MNVFKISLPGHDARDAKLADEAVDSLYPSPKVSTIASPPHAGIIFLDWQTTTPIPAGTQKTLYSFPHGYNHIPSTIGAFTFDNGSLKFSGNLGLQYGDLGYIALDADPINVNLKYISLDSGSTPIPPFIMRIRFYVFAERGYA